MTEPIRAAGYIRVSTEDQRKHGWNLGDDRERIERTVAERGWPLHAIYDDGGLQGDDPTRPGFTRMLAEADEFDVLIMRDLDRFSRRLAIYAAAVDDLLEAGVALYEFEGDGGTGLRPLNLDDEDDRALADIKAVFAQLEKAKTKRRVRQSVQARARAGRHLGVAPYAYRFEDKLLVVIPHEAVIVERIFADYVRGSSQRAIARALTATESGRQVEEPSGGRARSGHPRPCRLRGEGRAQRPGHRRRTRCDRQRGAVAPRPGEAHRRPWPQGRPTPGRGHLLVGGVLRCGRCGEAMITDRLAAPGWTSRYECWGRKEHGPEFCDQPSILRELIDEPFRAHLLNGYIDLAATERRIAERTAAAVTLARHALADAEADAARIERALATTERDYDAGEIDGRQYAKREARLTEELDGARNALQRASEHAQEAERPRRPGTPNSGSSSISRRPSGPSRAASTTRPTSTRRGT